MGYIPTMPYARFVPTALLGLLIPLVSLAQQEPAPTPAAPAPAAPVPEPPSMALNRLDEATIKVRLMERIAAKIEQSVSMLNQQFKLVGNYYKDTNHRLRLQLKLEGLGDTGSDLLQVCDGKILWDYQKVLGMQSYRKREIEPILKKLEDPIIDPFFKSLVISQLGFGGPEAMMTGLRRSVTFDQVAPETIDVDGTSVEVWVIGGTWSDRSKLLGQNDRPLPPTATLPPYIPSNVRVFVGKVDGWPYRIEMIGNAPSLLQAAQDTRAIDPASGRPVGQPRKPPKVDPSKIILTYRLLPPTEINRALFLFQPPSDLAPGTIDEDTVKFVAQLDEYIQIQTARKKAEEAKGKGEDSELKTRIEVPDPGAAGLGTLPTPETSAPK